MTPARPAIISASASAANSRSAPASIREALDDGARIRNAHIAIRSRRRIFATATAPPLAATDQAAVMEKSGPAGEGESAAAIGAGDLQPGAAV
jgi:hypothetical protein